MLKVAREAISTNSRSPDYTLWKSVAKSNYLLDIMSVLLSLPFMYGFINTKWVNVTNFILRKKSGPNKIHMIQIIRKMDAECNTMMKHYSKLAAHNYERSSPSDEQ